MSPARLELIVDAAQAELGEGAALSDIRELSSAAAERWADCESAPACIHGIEINVVPDPGGSPRSEDTRQALWEWTSRSIAAAPHRMPVLLHLHGFADAAARLTSHDIFALATQLDQLVADAGIPALRLEWADGVHPGSGDHAVLEVLPEVLASHSRLTGHVRFASVEGRVNLEMTQRLLSRIEADQGLLGLACRGQLSRDRPGIYLRCIGTFSSAACRAAAGAWTQRALTKGREQSGYPVYAEPSQPEFDVPTRTPSGTSPISELERLASTGRAGIIWI